jgi:N-acetylglucosaminyldiphosphoundecaprenol N-acetyl-beta-D-mannosaminyltransferase
MARALGERVRVGDIAMDPVTLIGAIDCIVELAESGVGGTVFTPNVDHVVVASESEEFRQAYREVSLSLVDGMPVFWASRLLGRPLPEKVSGSDLFEPLLAKAAERGLPVFLFGGMPGTAELAAERLQHQFSGLKVVGTFAPKMSASGVIEDEEATLKILQDSGAKLVFVACGAPKSELFSARVRTQLSPMVLLCVGAAIDFAAGTAKRAPRWVSRIGLEWAYRLLREPRRLAKRYLLRDPKFFWLLSRQLFSRA